MGIQNKFDSIKEDQYFKFLMENAIDVIWFYDSLKNRFTYISPSVKQLLGYTPEEMLALGIKETLTEDAYQKVQELVKELSLKIYEGELNPSHTISIEIEEVRKDDSTVWFEFRDRLILDEKRRARGLVGITRDITERKVLEERLRRKPTKLEREIRRRTKQLNDANTALQVVLNRKDEDLHELEDNIRANIRELIVPLIEKLKISRPTKSQLACLDILESSLRDIVSPFAKGLSSQLSKLSHTEIQVANFSPCPHTSTSKSILLVWIRLVSISAFMS